jgi:hypothetical protein
MYNGIDTQEFDREKDYGSDSRRKEKRLLCIGGVWPHKGAHVLQDAFKIVVARYSKVRLDIVSPRADTILWRRVSPNSTAECSAVLCQKPRRTVEVKAWVGSLRSTDVSGCIEGEAHGRSCQQGYSSRRMIVTLWPRRSSSFSKMMPCGDVWEGRPESGHLNRNARSLSWPLPTGFWERTSQRARA